MAPLLLRGLLAMALAISVALGAGWAIGRASDDPRAHPEVLATVPKLQKAGTLLRQGRGPLRRRAQAVRRQLNLKLHLCPPEPRGRVLAMDADGIDLVIGRHRRGALRLALEGLGKHRHGATYLCTPVDVGPPIHRGLAAALAGAALFAGMVIFLLPATRRLRRIETVVRAVAEGRIEERTADGGEDVIGQLARAVDEIGERTQGLLAAQRRLQASVSHELRTPLARLAAAVDLAEDHPNPKLFAGMRQDIDELDQLVEEMLTMARLQDRSVRLQRGPTALVRLASERIDAHRRAEAAIGWQLSGLDEATVQGDARLLGRLLDNLFSNARRHAAEQIAVTIFSEDGRICMAVDDDGCGVQEADKQRIFQAFQSGDRAGSAGLGLAICHEIANAHGAEIAVLDGPLGGARFLLRFPA